MASVAIQCIQCAYYRVECKGSPTACGNYPGKNKNEQNKKDGVK
jgi:hypothetical protein